MPKLTHRINAFNAGELGPEVYGRVDLAKYATGAAKIENYIVHPEGGVHRRPGTRFVIAAKNNAVKSRLIPFIFSTDQAYVLELSDKRIRVFADEINVQAPVGTFLDAAVGTTTEEIAITDHGYADSQGPLRLTTTGTLPGGLALATDYYIVSPASRSFTDADVNTGTDQITITAHGYSDQMGPFRLATTGAIPTGLQATIDYFVNVVDSNTITLALTAGGGAIDITAASFGGVHAIAPTNNYRRDKFRLSLSAGGAAVDITSATGGGTHTITPTPGFPLEIVSPYTEAELYDLHFVQSADFLFLVHKDHRPVQLTRTGNTKWALDFVNLLDGPYGSKNIETTTLTASATTGDVLLTASAITGINKDTGWKATDIGRMVRMKVGTKDWGWLEITGVQSTTVARALVRGTLGDTTATTDWQLGSWYVGNYPQAISFFEQRLGFAGEPDTPQTLHGSRSGNFNNFAPTELDDTLVEDNGIDFQIGANQVSSIRWLAVGRQLFMGTPSGIFVGRASSDNEAITPFNVNIPQTNVIGTRAVQPVNIGTQVIYVSRNSQTLRGLKFSFTDDSFDAVDVTLLARHILGRNLSVTTMSFQLERQSVLWLTRSDGVLAAVTYIPEQEVFAWHRHILGGSFGTGAAVVESVAVIPSMNEDHDQVWMTVKRTVNGATVRHVEFFEDEWLDGVATQLRYVDGAPAAYSGVAKSTFSGLDHLEGETVSVLADGAVHPDRVVASGSITLDASYTDVVAGLKYTSDLETLPLEFADPQGGSSGKVARIDHVSIRYHESLGGQIGPDVTHLDPIPFRGGDDLMDTPVPFFSGDLKVAIDGGFKRDKRLYIRQDQPLPMNILAMNLFVGTAER